MYYQLSAVSAHAHADKLLGYTYDTPVMNFMLQHEKFLSQNFNIKTLYIKILLVYLGTKTSKQNDYTNHNTKI